MIKFGNIVILLLIMFTIVWYYSVSYINFDKDTIKAVLIIAGVLSLYWLFVQQYSMFHNKWVKPSNLFFLSNLVVSFQWLADKLLNNDPDSQFLKITDSPYVHGGLLGLSGLLAFILGYSVLLKYKSNIKRYSRYKVHYNKITILYVLEYVFFLLFIYNINLTDFFLGTAYKTSSDAGAYRYFEGLFNYTIVAILALKVSDINEHDRANWKAKKIFRLLNYIFWIPVIIYIILRGISGDRGPVITLILLFFFTYIYITHIRIKIIVLLGCVFVGGATISIIGIARLQNPNMTLTQRFSTSVDEFLEGGRFGGNTVSVPTQELSISYVCTHEAIDQVENKGFKYGYGRYQLVHIVQLIPYAPSFLRETLNLTDADLSSSEVITSGLLGENANWSTGTDMIADFYLDFGLMGVILGYFFVGLTFYWLDKNLVLTNRGLSPYLLGIILYLSSKSLYMPRSAFLGEMRPITYILLLVVLNNFIARCCFTPPKFKGNKHNITEL